MYTASNIISIPYILKCKPGCLFPSRTFDPRCQNETGVYKTSVRTDSRKFQKMTVYTSSFFQLVSHLHRLEHRKIQILCTEWQHERMKQLTTPLMYNVHHEVYRSLSDLRNRGSAAHGCTMGHAAITTYLHCSNNSAHYIHCSCCLSTVINPGRPGIMATENAK